MESFFVDLVSDKISNNYQVRLEYNGYEYTAIDYSDNTITFVNDVRPTFLQLQANTTDNPVSYYLYEITKFDTKTIQLLPKKWEASTAYDNARYVYPINQLNYGKDFMIFLSPAATAAGIFVIQNMDIVWSDKSLPTTTYTAQIIPITPDNVLIQSWSSKTFSET